MTHAITMRIAWFLLLCCAVLTAQELTLHGAVRDLNTRREIPGATVAVPELNAHTITNTAGRFSLTVVVPEPEMVVEFQHQGFDTLRLTVEEVLSRDEYLLQERVVWAPDSDTPGFAEQLAAETDLAGAGAEIDARVFYLGGYLDVANLLRAETGLRVEDALKGKTALSFRASSPDEVVVLYNGLRLNSAIDKSIDLSLLELSDLERLEIIRGSRTALYGPDAYAGVVNVVPRAQRDHTVRVQQQVGPNNSANFGVNLAHQQGPVSADYTLRKGGLRQKLNDRPAGRRLLENLTEHHTASLAYRFDANAAGQPTAYLGLMYVRSRLDFENESDNETLDVFDQMVSGRYVGSLGSLTDVTLSGGYQWVEEGQFVRSFTHAADSGFAWRDMNSRIWHFNADRAVRIRDVRLQAGYQYRRSRYALRDDRILLTANPFTLRDGELDRRHHGLVGVATYAPGEGVGRGAQPGIDLSARYDIVRDEPVEPDYTNPGKSPLGGENDLYMGNTWKEGTVKFAAYLNGNDGTTRYSTAARIGTNVRIPTLMQQASRKEILTDIAGEAALRPERNRGFELSGDITRETRSGFGLFGYHLGATYFQNFYSDRIRAFYAPGTPIAFYDNVRYADLKGVELRQTLFLFRKKMTMQFGESFYDFSDAANFPYKPRHRLTANITINQGGYALKLHIFRDGPQVAQLRSDGGYSMETVPRRTNLDLHFSKSVDLFRTRLILNASVRNLLKDDYALAGLPLHEQRLWLTLGVQY